MGCKKGKSSADAKAGNYACKKCGAVVKKKGKVCKPKKIKE
jgi:transcription initiation factor TFIIIB Brf1 subunit/transcription initiation factor TFIIB